ncbi:hypothetical protein E8E11_009175 [Didymella keratinophila]|nr:hypothetical protein E8E11_009175 [Didymella keratinophila]
MLALMLLAAAEVVNEQTLISKRAGAAQDERRLSEVEMRDLTAPIGNDAALLDGRPNSTISLGWMDLRLEGWVLSGALRTKQQLDALVASPSVFLDEYNNAVTAQRTAKVSCVIWVFHAALYTYAGLSWDFEQFEASSVTALIMWKSLQIFLSTKRIMNQLYFARVEAKLKRGYLFQTQKQEHRILVLRRRILMLWHPRRAFSLLEK